MDESAMNVWKNIDQWLVKWAEQNRWRSFGVSFRRALYLFLLLNTLFYLPIMGDLWGGGALIVPARVDTLSELGDLPIFLSIPGYRDWYPVFIGVQLIALILGLFGKAPRLSALAVLLTTFPLYESLWQSRHAGLSLIQFFILYQVLLKEGSSGDPSRFRNQVGNVLSNTGLWAIRLQVLFMYGGAVGHKLVSPQWLKGEGLYYSLAVPQFSHPWIRENLIQHEWLMVSGNYFVILFQLLFPILIWSTTWRKPFLGIGVLMHLFIAFGMGMFDFGLAVLVGYVAFTGLRVGR